MSTKFINIRHSGELDEGVEYLMKASGESTITGAVKYAVTHFRSLMIENADLRGSLDQVNDQYYHLQVKDDELREALQVVARYAKPK